MRKIIPFILGLLFFSLVQCKKEDYNLNMKVGDYSTPDLQVFTPDTLISEYPIDLDKDGINEFIFYSQYQGILPYQTFTAILRSPLESTTVLLYESNKLLFVEKGFSGWEDYEWRDSFSVVNLKPPNTISYIPFRFKDKDGRPHQGWVKLFIDREVRIIEYAYV